MLAKRPRYCSSELKFTWTVQTQSKKMHGAGGEENRPGNERTTAMFEGLLASRSVLPFASALSSYSLLAFFFWASPLQSSFLSLSSGFLHFLLPCSADLICKNESKDRKAVPAGLWFLFFFLFFLRFLPFFFLLCLVFCVFFLSLSGNWDGWRQWYCSFCAQPVVTASGDSENIGHAGWWSLFLFFPSVDALCGDDEGDGDENVLCWLSSRPCLCFFFAFDSGVLLSFFFRSSPFFFCLASLLFFSCLSFLVFLYSLLSFSVFSFSSLGQHPRLLYSLYMALFRKQLLH